MNLKDLRIESGIKAKKIASLLGVSRVQVYNYENNKCKLKDEQIEILAETYRVPCELIKEIIGDTKDRE